ncbi:HAMP domain-containing histidine kinase [Bacillus sp. BGMRC 2118]|nr:HAMP domain-containing histidine kinase [Bacillus sp. BGMRC 2118]
MKIKYLYQLLASHLSLLIIAFLVLSLLFSHYIEELVFQNKVDELTAFGEKILNDSTGLPFKGGERQLSQYSELLRARQTEFIVFNDQAKVVYSRGNIHPELRLHQKEWEKLQTGEFIKLKKDIGRFGEDVSLVALPSIQGGKLAGGILLLSPISGTREVIGDINQYLLYTVLISLSISFMVSYVLSKLHVKRIQRIREATSMIASGNYDVHMPASNFDEISELAKDFNRMAERLKMSNEEIESLENRRRNFMADVSHELRTPLTTISGVIEGLRNNMIREEQRENGFDLISKESKRLIRLVNENLDYEKIRSNQIEINKVEIQLSEVLEILQDQLSIQAEEKGNQIHLSVESSIYVFADYDRLIQMIMNIVRNSIQFTDNGHIWLRGKTSSAETIIEIEDTGIGIDSEQIEMIWHRFYKADLSRSNNPYGEFGLGLSIVKKLVELHNGRIEVQSEKNVGTLFTIYLPHKN